MDEDKTVLTPTEASGGSTSGGKVRLVLIVSLVLIVIAFAAIYISHS